MNLSRILRIIRYDPALYMNPQKMNTMAEGKRNESDHYYPSINSQKANINSDPRQGLIDVTRKNNVGFNLFQVLSKYIKIDQFL